jgi:hypothetical protein
VGGRNPVCEFLQPGGTAKFCTEAKVQQVNLPFESFGNQHEFSAL